MCYILLDGESDRILAEGIVLALTSWEGERCLLKDFEVKSFVEQQNSVVQVLSAQGQSSSLFSSSDESVD